MSDESICLSPAEIAQITGWKHARKQLDELHARGFWRARLNIRHQVVLERAHYEAVCAGALPPGSDSGHTDRPQLQPIPQRSKRAA